MSSLSESCRINQGIEILRRHGIGSIHRWKGRRRQHLRAHGVVKPNGRISVHQAQVVRRYAKGQAHFLGAAQRLSQLRRRGQQPFTELIAEIEAAELIIEILSPSNNENVYNKENLGAAEAATQAKNTREYNEAVNKENNLVEIEPTSNDNNNTKEDIKKGLKSTLSINWEDSQ